MANSLLRAILGATLLVISAVTQAGEWRYDGQTAASPGTAADNPGPVAQAPAAEPGMALPPPAPSAPGVELPRSGTKLDKVRAQFGPPQQEIPAVGDPPILRWKYPEYIVYFEYDLVITSVPIDI